MFSFCSTDSEPVSKGCAAGMVLVPGRCSTLLSTLFGSDHADARYLPGVFAHNHPGRCSLARLRWALRPLNQCYVGEGEPARMAAASSTPAPTASGTTTASATTPRIARPPTCRRATRALPSASAMTKTIKLRMRQMRSATGRATYAWGFRRELNMVIDGAGTIRRWENDLHGNTVAATCAEGHATRFVRDDRGRLICTIFPEGAAACERTKGYGRRKEIYLRS